MNDDINSLLFQRHRLIRDFDVFLNYFTLVIKSVELNSVAVGCVG